MCVCICLGVNIVYCRWLFRAHQEVYILKWHSIVVACLSYFEKNASLSSLHQLTVTVLSPLLYLLIKYYIFIHTCDIYILHNLCLVCSWIMHYVAQSGFSHRVRTSTPIHYYYTKYSTWVPMSHRFIVSVAVRTNFGSISSRSLPFVSGTKSTTNIRPMLEMTAYIQNAPYSPRPAYMTKKKHKERKNGNMNFTIVCVLSLCVVELKCIVPRTTVVG